MLHDGWAVLCQIGLWGWIVSTMVLIVKAFPVRSVINIQAAGRWGGVVAVCFALWVLGMVLA